MKTEIIKFQTNIYKSVATETYKNHNLYNILHAHLRAAISAVADFIKDANIASVCSLASSIPVSASVSLRDLSLLDGPVSAKINKYLHKVNYLHSLSNLVFGRNVIYL